MGQGGGEEGVRVFSLMSARLGVSVSVYIAAAIPITSNQGQPTLMTTPMLCATLPVASSIKNIAKVNWAYLQNAR